MRRHSNVVFLAPGQLRCFGICVTPRRSSLQHIGIADMVGIRFAAREVVLNPLQTVLVKTCRMMGDTILMKGQVARHAGPAVGSGTQFLSAPLISEDYDRCMCCDRCG